MWLLIEYSKTYHANWYYKLLESKPTSKGAPQISPYWLLSILNEYGSEIEINRLIISI